ncbi:MAG: FAD-dependent oxidoreductase, partial [Dehalococcoidia bacterium]
SSSSDQKQGEYNYVLVAVGMQGNVDGMGLEELGVEVEKGFIKIDDHMTTNVSGIYAIGDVTGKTLLAHVASAQGHIVAEAIAGRDTVALNYENMPRATYCQPQVASLGLTEAQAVAQGHQIKVGRFPFRANGKALGIGEPEGMVKIVADAQYGDIVGAHLIGHEVTEMLAELSLAKTLEATPLEIGNTVHAHPTLSEVLKEAALDVDNEAIHM